MFSNYSYKSINYAFCNLMLNLSLDLPSPDSLVSNMNSTAGFLASYEYKSSALSIFPSTFRKLAASY